YGKDAFTGLRIMDDLCADDGARRDAADLVGALAESHPAEEQRGRGEEEKRRSGGGEYVRQCTTVRAVASSSRSTLHAERSTVPPPHDIPVPPFLGSRVTAEIDVCDVFRYLNERALISTQWQFRKSGMKPSDYERLMQETVYPLLERMKKMCIEERLLEPRVVY